MEELSDKYVSRVLKIPETQRAIKLEGKAKEATRAGDYSVLRKLSLGTTMGYIIMLHTTQDPRTGSLIISWAFLAPARTAN